MITKYDARMMYKKETGYLPVSEEFVNKYTLEGKPLKPYMIWLESKCGDKHDVRMQYKFSTSNEPIEQYTNYEYYNKGYVEFLEQKFCDENDFIV